jgi:hypothetical protein
MSVGACYQHGCAPLSSNQSLAGLANLYASVGGRLTSHTRTADALVALTDTAVQMVPGAEHSAITRAKPGQFETIAATSDMALRTDLIQYEVSSGPCVDAVLQATVFRTGDLRTDPRWPLFGWRAFEATGVLSMLSLGLFLEDGDGVMGLNMYSTQADAFDEEAETVGTLLATHGGLAVAAAAAFERVGHLEVALASNREIGVAMGVLMNQHKITREQAFDVLRIASQHSHRKLSEIASTVADTGVLELPGHLGARQARPPRRGHEDGRNLPPGEGGV